MGASYASGPFGLRDGGIADLRDITLGGVRVLDGVYFSIRDRLWNPVEVREISPLEESRSGETVILSWTLESAVGAAVVRSAVTVTLSPTRIDFVATLSASATIDLNRIGFVVLHPLESVGRPVTFSTAAGVEGAGRFPSAISSWQPFRELTSIDTGAVRIDFRGAAFETEDHRNWSDAGFKSYSPPLDRVPMELVRAQSVVVGVSVVAAARPSATDAGVAPRPDGVTVKVGHARAGRLPTLGIGASRAGTAPEVPPFAPAFLSVEVTTTDVGRRRLYQAFAEAGSWRAPLDVLLVSDGLPDSRWLDLLADLAPAIRRLSLVDAASGMSSPELLDATRAGLLRRRADRLAGSVGGGARGYFAELGRSRDVIAPHDPVRFALSPAVHHTDPERILDTTRSLGYLARDARAIAAGGYVTVAPITFAQRLSIHEVDGDEYGPYSDRYPQDVRESEQLGATWAIAAIAGLQSVDAVSIFTTDSMISHGHPTPVATLLAELARHPQAELIDTEVSDPRRIAALGIATDVSPILYLANLSSSDVFVRCGGAAVADVTVPARGTAVVRF